MIEERFHRRSPAAAARHQRRISPPESTAHNLSQIFHVHSNTAILRLHVGATLTDPVTGCARGARLETQTRTNDCWSGSVACRTVACKTVRHFRKSRLLQKVSAIKKKIIIKQIGIINKNYIENSSDSFFFFYTSMFAGLRYRFHRKKLIFHA